MHTKTFSIIFLFLFFVSCGGSGGGGNTPGASTQAGIETSSSSSPSNQDTGPVPTAADTFEVNARLFGFSVNQEEKVHQASELIKQVVASQEFKNRVLNHKYKGKKTFVDNNGLTNAQIYSKILEAAEKVAGGGANNTMDLELELYTDSTNVVGYTLPSVVRVWMNTKYFNGFKPYQVAGNMFHEWLHKIGFGHDYEATASRPYSVPYAVGYIIRDMAKKYYNS